MADLKELEETVEGFQSFVNNSFATMVNTFGAGVASLGDILSQAFSGSDTDISEGIKKTADGLKALQIDARKAAGDLGSISFDSAGLTREVIKSKDAFMSFTNNLAEEMKDGFKQSFGQIGDVIEGGIGPGVAIAAASARKEIIDKLSGLSIQGISFGGAEKEIMSLRKSILDAANSFGALDSSSREVNMQEFTARMRESSTALGVTQKEVESVSKEISKGFGLNAAIQPLEKFNSLQDEAQSTFTATNAAIRVAQATGQDFATITNAMSEAALTLNMSLEESIEMFGRIENSTKLSGIGFKATQDALMASAKSLRMFGADINTVAPAFDTFAKSMSERGMRGLTSELATTFTNAVSSISNDLGKSAFLGLQAGLGEAGGALGASIEMEAALQDGDLTTVMDSITSTLERFGGGQIVTLQEAREDPTKQLQFVQQRELLSQFGIRDTAAQSRVLEALQDAQRTGVATESAQLDVQEALTGVIDRGADIEAQTVTTQQRSALDLEAAQLAANEKIVDGVEKLLTGSDFSKIMGSYTDSIRDLAENRITPAQAAGRVIGTIQDPSKKIRETLNEPETERKMELVQREIGIDPIKAALIDNMTSAEKPIANQEDIIGRAGEGLSGITDEQIDKLNQALRVQYGPEELSRLQDLSQKSFQGDLGEQEAQDLSKFFLSQENLFNAIKESEQVTGQTQPSEVISNKEVGFDFSNLRDAGISLEIPTEEQTRETVNRAGEREALSFVAAMEQDTRGINFSEAFDVGGFAESFKEALTGAINNVERKEIPVDVNINLNVDRDTIKINATSEIAEAFKTGVNQ